MSLAIPRAGDLPMTPGDRPNKSEQRPWPLLFLDKPGTTTNLTGHSLTVTKWHVWLPSARRHLTPRSPQGPVALRVLVAFVMTSGPWNPGIWATNWPCQPEPAARLPGSEATCP